MPKKKAITAAELATLASILPGSTLDIDSYAETHLGKSIRAQDFDALLNSHQLKQCIDCERWQETSEFASDRDHCLDCQSANDETDD